MSTDDIIDGAIESCSFPFVGDRDLATEALRRQIWSWAIRHPASPYLLFEAMERKDEREALSGVCSGQLVVQMARAQLALAECTFDRTEALAALLVAGRAEEVIRWAEARAGYGMRVERSIVALAWRVLGEAGRALDEYSLAIKDPMPSVRCNAIVAGAVVARLSGRRRLALEFENAAVSERRGGVRAARRAQTVVARRRQAADLEFGSLSNVPAEEASFLSPS